MAKTENTVQQAKTDFEKTQEAWSGVYDKSKEDLLFLSDEPSAQWNQQDYNERIKTGRPALTLDKLGQFTRQVVNQIRMNTPTINVIPSTSGADEETAEVFKGLIKNIEYQSGADDAYDTGALFSVRSGIGFIRVDHDYVDDESFEQELLIKRVINPLACFIDPDSIEIDGSDAKFAFILDKIKVKEFKRLYPKLDPISFIESENSGDKKDTDYITIAEYFKVVESEKDMAIYDEEPEEYSEERGEPKSKRTVKKKRIKRCKLSGADVLEETTFPGRYIPLVPVYGEENWIDGKREVFSLIRKAKSAQQLHNYWKSLETEIIMKQPQAPVMAAEGQVEDYAADWKNPGKTSVLRYKQTDSEGRPAPAPIRLNPPTTPTGVFNATLATVDDIKASLGMYNSSIGQSGNETSGIAIQRRKQEGEVGTFHFADNLNKSIAQVGRILVFAIPEIYDTKRIIRIIGEEDQPKMVSVNGNDGESFDLTKGKYDVRVTTGANFTTMRQEAADFFTQIVGQQPDLMKVMGDLMFKYMDFPGAQVMAERIKKTIPPELLESEDGEEVDPEKLQLQQQLQQAQMQLQQIVQEGQKELESLQMQLKNKDVEAETKQGELVIKAQSEQAKNENDKLKLEIEMKKLALEERQKNFDNAIKEQELLLKAKELELKEIELVGRALQTAEIDEGQSLGNEANVIQDGVNYDY